MRLPASLRSSGLLAEEFFFAAGIVGVTTQWFMLQAAISWRVLHVPDHLWVGLVGLAQLLPALALTAALFWIRRRTPGRATLVRALLGAVTVIFIGLHLGGSRFESFANDLSGGVAFWSALGIYLALASVISAGVVKISLRFQQMTASIFRTLGVLGTLVAAFVYLLLSSDRMLSPAYLLPELTPDSSTASPLSPVAAEPGALPPVFVLVFDELSYDALLDRDGRLDRDEYPGFARLADQSVVFTDARSNFFDTAYALPALVEALTPYTTVGELRLYLQYRAVELALAPACVEVIRCVGISEIAQHQTGTVFRHLVVSFAEDLIPSPFSSLLRGATNAASRAVGVPTSVVDSTAVHLLESPFETRLLDDLQSAPPGNSITVLHTLTSHHPYVLDADGSLGERFFGPPQDEVLTEIGHHLPDASDRTAELPPGAQPIEIPGLYDAYQGQIRYADGLLGRFLDSLDDRGLLDESIVILTADHGLRLRYPGLDTVIEPDDWITRIPLFIHAPNLRPGTSDTPVQFQDLAATTFDLLDIDVQTSAGSISAFAEDRLERPAWFVVRGTWVHHRAADGSWPVVARVPDLKELRRGPVALPRLNRELLPCFAHPEDCSALPILLRGTPEFEAALAD